jgi:hypothetical protein
LHRDLEYLQCLTFATLEIRMHAII